MKIYIMNFILIVLAIVVNIFFPDYLLAVVILILAILFYSTIFESMMINNLKKREIKYKKTSKRKDNEYSTLLKTLDIGTIISDKKGKAIYRNDYVENHFVLETNVFRINNKKLRSFLKVALTETKETKTEISQDKKYFIVKVTPVIEKEVIDRYIILFYDATEIKLFSASQKTFISDASHELKTPITSILNVIDILDRNKNEMNIDEELLSILSKESKRMELIVYNLLKLIKLEQKEVAVNKEKLDVLNDTKVILDELSNKDIEFRFNSNVKEIMFDKVMFKRLVRNLLKNAFKYAKTKVELKIRLRDSKLTIEVLDDGIGIKESEYENVFRRFYRIDSSRDAKTGGTGIGLSIVSNIVKHNEGTIRVESELNKYTKFIVEFENPEEV